MVDYITNYADTCKRITAYKMMYKNTAKHLVAFEQKLGRQIKADQLSVELLHDFLLHLRSKGMKPRSAKNVVSITCFFLRKMQREGYKIDPSFTELRITTEPPPPIYLTTSEIEKLSIIPLNEALSRVRDVFVVMCYTGLRWSDACRLDNCNLEDNTITCLTKKTTTHVVIPIHSSVRIIIERWSGLPQPQCSLQYFNVAIKEICRLANITELANVDDYTNGKKRQVSKPKHQLISSHTARRSFATNAYLAGIPPARIMLMTGHSTEDAFFRYICINKKENAITLANNPFFNP